MPHHGEVSPGEEGVSCLQQMIRKHRFDITSLSDGNLRVLYTPRDGGSVVEQDLKRTEMGYDKQLHDTEYVLEMHNKAEDRGKPERVISTELELPQGIPLEHQLRQDDESGCA